MLFTLAFFYLFPSSPAFFRVFYAVAPSKTNFLQDYHRKIWNHGGGYVPLPTQQFLCSRLENPASDAETQAIADFYATQGFGREYGPLDKLSDAAKIRLIDALFRHLPIQPLRSRLRSLFLIEEVRRGEMIGKGYFWVTDYPRFTHYLKIHPGHRKGHEEEDVFQEVLLEWWSSKLPDREKLHQNPLAKAGLDIGGI